jgi:ligand-binding sensor domain-containing protein
MKRTFLGLLSVAVLSVSGSTSAAVGEWTTYARLDVRRVAVTESAVWAATGGGILRSNLSDGTARTFSPSEGLSDANIRSVVVDENGTVWFGSENGGLIRFVQKPGLPQPVIENPALLEGEVTSVRALWAQGETLYVGHSVGLTVVDLTSNNVVETYHQLGTDDGNRNKQITAISVVDGRLIVGLESGVAIGDLSTNLLVPSAWEFIDSTAFKNSRAILPFDRHTYIATTAGLYRSAFIGWDIVLDGTEVSDLTVFDGSIWAATDMGLLHSENGSDWTTTPGLADTMFAMDSEPDGVLVVAGTGGTWQIDGTDDTTPTKIPGVDFPAYNLFRQIAVDSAGSIWAAPGRRTSTAERLRTLGFLRLHDDQWTHYSPSAADHFRVPAPPDESGYIRTVVDHSNRAWITTFGGGAVIVDPSVEPATVTRVYDGNSTLWGLNDATHFIVANAIDVGPSGWVWMGVWHSLAWAFPPDYVPGTDEPIHIAARFIGSEIGSNVTPTAILMDGAGVLWIGTSNGILLIDTGGTPADTTDDQFVGAIDADGSGGGVSLLDNAVTCLTTDRDGAVWIGTEGGLTTLSGEYDRESNLYSLESKNFTVNNGLPSSFVRAVTTDSANVKWVGTETGVAQISSGGRVVALAANRLADPTGRVVSLAYDQKTGAVWIGTERGLNKYQAYDLLGGEGVSVQPSATPYKIGLDRRGDDYVLSGDPLTFLLTPGASLRIYTLTGDLVWEDVDSGIGQLTWDGRTRSQEKVAGSGIYLYVAERDGMTKIGKIAVLRDAR